MSKWPVQKPTHIKTKEHVEHQDATDIKKQPNFFSGLSDFFFFFMYIFLNDFSKKCWVTALVRPMTVIGGLKTSYKL